MVRLCLKHLIFCILDYDKIYGFINKVLFLCNVIYRSDRKVTQRGSKYYNNFSSSTIRYHM